uniref:hypothetical protein n=1 Tax=Algoriphagus sp. TaxID=1872435 RepID=UPI004048208A
MKFGYLVAVLLSIYPVMQPFMLNIQVLNWNQTLIPLSIIVIFSTLLYLFFSIKIKNPYTKAIIVPVITNLFFLYNFLHVFLISQPNFLNLIGRHRFLIPTLLIIAFYFVYWVSFSELKIKKALLVFLIVLNLMPFSNLFYTKSSVLESQIKDYPVQKLETHDKNFPDVFFIILDMYPSNLVLKKYFGFDNKDFTNKLDSLGFNVFYNSKSNYSRTSLSLASILNMDYIHRESDTISNELTVENLNYILENGKVQSYFKKKGYNFYWFEGGYLSGKKDYSNNEIFIPVSGSLYSRQESVDNDFLMYFINNSILSPFSERIKIISVDIFRKRINNILFNLPVLVENKDHKFVFAHIMAPHPPFIFGENGEKIYSSEDNKSKKSMFINQLKYINKRMIDVLENMININNGREKIIIIQGDHGTRETLPNSIYSFSQNWAEEAFGNLSVIYFSDTTKNSKVKYFSPVNTFRFVFNEEFNEDFILLEDKQFYSDFTFPLKIHKIE